MTTFLWPFKWHLSIFVKTHSSSSKSQQKSKSEIFLVIECNILQKKKTKNILFVLYQETKFIIRSFFLFVIVCFSFLVVWFYVSIVTKISKLFLSMTRKLSTRLFVSFHFVSLRFCCCFLYLFLEMANQHEEK